MVIAPQRELLLTSREMVNMIRALVGDAEADAIAGTVAFGITPDDLMRFPPADGEDRNLNPTLMLRVGRIAKHVGAYVADNFATLAGCAPASDDCARAYLAAFAQKAYRRPLDAGEQSDLQDGYDGARPAATIEEATQQVVATILAAHPFLFRSETGDANRPPSAPPGVPLAPYELASALSFFLTDGPPDQPLLDAARAGTLTLDTVGPQVDRLLATSAARDWLRTIMELYFHLNFLSGVTVDPSIAPVDAVLLGDMRTEARMFLDHALWDGALTDLFTSRATFLNSTLATIVYQVPVPPGATATSFVATMLPADQRSGLITNAGYMTAAARTEGVHLVYRGRVLAAMLGFMAVPLTEIGSVLKDETFQIGTLAEMPGAQQVAYRASMPECADCHQHFDPYGLALNGYDVIGRKRTVDEHGHAADAHATLPPELGGAVVNGAVDLAQAMARSPLFVNRLATMMLQYAMVDESAEVEGPTFPGSPPRAACAVNDLLQRYRSRPTQTFAGLIRDVATSPAFALRQVHSAP